MAQIKSDDREIRILQADDVELRVVDGESPKITGYAAKYGKWSEDLGGFREKIKKGAFDSVLDNDVRALKNHDPNLILGRSPKTLRLTSNSVGLAFEIDVPDTTTGRDTLEEIRRGDLTGCSFSFRTGEDDWKYLEDGSIERTLVSFKELFDVGPVTYPAYPDTTVAARSLESFKTEQTEVLDEQLEIITPERQAEIDRKYRTLGRISSQCRPADADA